MADIVRRASDKADIRHLSDLNSIICNKSVSALYKLDSSLALTYAALTCYEHTFAVDLDKNTVASDPWCKGKVEESDETCDKV